MMKKVTFVFLLTASVAASIAGSAFAASMPLSTDYRTPIIKIVPPDPYTPIIIVVPPDLYRN